MAALRLAHVARGVAGSPDVVVHIFVMGLLRHIAACNQAEISKYIPFRVGGRAVGYVRPDLARRIVEWDGAFRSTGDALELDPAVEDADERSAAFDRIGPSLLEAGAIRKLRVERYSVLERWGASPLASIDRGMVTPFGLRAFGVHINGFVRDASGGLSVWVARRARDRAVDPGKLDNMVAGGLPHGLTLAQNLVKEGWEEAGLTPETLSRAKPVGAVSYTMETRHGLKPDTMFLFDLELPPGLVPHNTDGEVESFELWPAQRVMESVRDTDDWKFNVGLTMIDFLIRHGLIHPDHPDYALLVRGLHR